MKTELEARPAPAEVETLTNGRAVAAYWSTGIGLLTLAVVNLGTEISKAFQTTVHGIGKLWMPGAAGIGPYSGKETLTLVAWLGSWLVLGLWLRRREVREPASFIGFLVVLGTATTLLWPPVTHWVAHLLH